MRIVVVGSGGVGGYFGAQLARAGEQVCFVARGAHLEAMRSRGLRVESQVHGDWTVEADAVETLSGREPADIVLFCVKSFDTDAAAQLLHPVVGPDTAIISLQNGVDNEDKLASALGTGKIMGGVAYVFANISAPGVIAHHQFGRVVFGEFDDANPDRVRAIKDVLENALIPAEVSPDIRRNLWDKYVFQTAQGGTTALTRLPTWIVREVPETRRLWQMQVEELLAVAASAGVGLEEGALARYGQFLDSLAPGNYSSLYQDLVNGRRLELEAFHGHAIKLGHKFGIATPTLTAVDAALRPYLVGNPMR